MTWFSTKSDRIAGLKTAADELKNALKTCNAEKIDAFVSDEYMGIGIYGTFETKRDILDYYLPGSMTITEYISESEQYEVFGEIGIVTGRGRISGRFGEHPFRHEVMFTDIFRRNRTGWKYYRSHLTEIRRTGSDSTE